MEIRQLKTGEEIALLARYRDDSTDPMLRCDWGQFVEQMAGTVPENPETMAVFAALDDNRVTGYIVVMICDWRPAYHYGTVLRLHTSQAGTTELLARKAGKWGRERGVKDVFISVYNEASKRLYGRLFGLKECGYQLLGEF